MIDNRYGKNKYDTQFNEWTTCHPFIIDCYYSYHYNNTSRCKVVRVGFIFYIQVSYHLSKKESLLQDLSSCAFLRVSSEPHACYLTPLHSARGSWNRKISELVEQKLVDLKVFPSSVKQVEFLVVF